MGYQRLDHRFSRIGACPQRARSKVLKVEGSSLLDTFVAACVVRFPAQIAGWRSHTAGCVLDFSHLKGADWELYIAGPWTMRIVGCALDFPDLEGTVALDRRRRVSVAEDRLAYSYQSPEVGELASRLRKFSLAVFLHQMLPYSRLLPAAEVAALPIALSSPALATSVAAERTFVSWGPILAASECTFGGWGPRPPVSAVAECRCRLILLVETRRRDLVVLVVEGVCSGFPWL